MISQGQPSRGDVFIDIELTYWHVAAVTADDQPLVRLCYGTSLDALTNLKIMLLSEFETFAHERDFVKLDLPPL